MDTFLYALDRSLIHIAASTFLFFVAFICLDFAQRHYWIPPLRGGWSYWVCGLVQFAIASLREVYDLHNGQPYFKCFTDWISWMAGIGLTIWALYRLAPSFYRIFEEMEEDRERRRRR